MSIYKRIYIFEKIIEKWKSPEFTIKDRELLYSKLINGQYDFCEENINYLYKTLVPWLEKENNITGEILIWYRSNSFPFFPFYLFSLLALCSVYKLATPSLVQKKNVICNLLQSIFAALDRKECTEVKNSFIKMFHTVERKEKSITSIIYQILIFIKQKCLLKKREKSGFQISFAMLFEHMCNLAGERTETASPGNTVSVNTLLVYQSSREKKERGITATLILEAIPYRFGELFPATDILRHTMCSASFLMSLKNVEAFIKNEIGIWPSQVDIRWQLIPDDREISLENKTLTGRSLEAAFVIGILKLYSRLDIQDKPALFMKELIELNLKPVAITATISKYGILGQVGGIWKKILEAARMKIAYVIIAREQNITETTKLVIIQAKNIKEAITKLHKEMGPEKINHRIKKLLLTYAIETKELENRCNDAFEGEDLTNIKGSVRFNDKPKIYVEDLIDICFHYNTINGKHPIIILLEAIERHLPFSRQDEIRELRIIVSSTISSKNNKKITTEASINKSSMSGLQVQRVSIKEVNRNFFNKVIPPLDKKGNPYVNRATIHHPYFFFGRKKNIKWLSRRIYTSSPQSISFVGERRIGKSSLMNYLTFLEGETKCVDNPGTYIFLYIDCQGLRSINEQQFISVLFTELKKKLKDNLELNIKGTIDDLRFLGEEITARSLKLILMFDEFESITKNKHIKPAFYSLLRSLANNYTIALITSSVKNLKDMCFSREISDSPFFNIFTIQHIGLFEYNEAKELITKPSLEYGIPLEILTDRIIKESGLHPFFLQIMCCSWFDYLESNGVSAEEMTKSKTPKEVLYHFREESTQHFEFIIDTMQEKEWLLLRDILKGKAFDTDSSEFELLERKGYVTRNKDDNISVFCSEFERFISQYRL